MPNIQPVILAGGSGSRLWPLSRELYPKQLLSFYGQRSLLQSTILRVIDLPDATPPLVMVGEEHRFLVKTQIEELGLIKTTPIILEPVSRNTAPPVCAAACYVAQSGGPENIILVLPADHIIKNEVAFRAAVAEAVELATAGSLVTFGIKPHGPETGYGYIQKGKNNEVISFVEKPDYKTAQEYLEQGNYYWNSGMFAFPVSVLLSEMAHYAPQITESAGQAVVQGTVDGPFFRLGREAFETCPSDSIDYALMEKSNKVAVVPADLGWSDIGSWKAIWEVSEKDEHGNVVQGDVMLEGVENCLIRSDIGLVAAVNLRDTLVIGTADAVLVAPLNHSQEVKKIVPRLKAKGREEYRLHRTVYRPWGSYTLLEEHPRFKIKRITVNPGHQLSLQRHFHRSEHWIVVRGTAQVTSGNKILLVRENESTYIPCGEWHRLENPGVIPLEMIEVQNGSYLGEDDIVRMEDDYGRLD